MYMWRPHVATPRRILCNVSSSPGQHITGDIALAARQYWYTSGDQDWLRNVGFPLANGTRRHETHAAGAPP